MKEIECFKLVSELNARDKIAKKLETVTNENDMLNHQNFDLSKQLNDLENELSTVLNELSSIKVSQKRTLVSLQLKEDLLKTETLQRNSFEEKLQISIKDAKLLAEKVTSLQNECLEFVKEKNNLEANDWCKIK